MVAVRAVLLIAAAAVVRHFIQPIGYGPQIQLFVKCHSSFEGMCYALFAALTVLILGLFLLVLFGMEAVLSVWMVRRQKRQSPVEQMRAQG